MTWNNPTGLRPRFRSSKAWEKQLKLRQVLVPQRRICCPRCASDWVRVSETRSPVDWLKELVGVRPLRCERCFARFSAFAPVLRVNVPNPAVKAPIIVDMATQWSQKVPDVTPLDDIQLIEAEWRERIHPDGLIEETLCAQLAHATWHLRCLHRAEREAIAVAVRNRSFNGESAISLMTWRRSAEAAIHNALEQLEGYRRIGPAASKAVPAEVSGLLALSQALEPQRHRRHHAASAAHVG